MPRCRRAASRGQVLLLRLLLVCVLVAAGRQEGKFTREALPAGQLPTVSVPLVRARWDYNDTREPLMDMLLGECEGYLSREGTSDGPR